MYHVYVYDAKYYIMIYVERDACKISVFVYVRLALQPERLTRAAASV